MEPGTPEFARLLDLYRIAVDEYRFQVDLNWNRTEHWFTLNAAVTGAAIALLHFAMHAAYLLVAALFAMAFCTCLVAAQGQRTQHNYYRASREHKRRLEQALELGEFALTTTPGMSGGGRRLRLHSLYIGLVLMLAGINLAGACYAGWRYDLSRAPTSRASSSGPPSSEVPARPRALPLVT